MTITLTSAIQNQSLQIGDDAYYVPQASGTPGSPLWVHSWDNSPVKLGKITNVSGSQIMIANPVNYPSSAGGGFLMFSKDKAVNNTSLLGYYAEVKLRNNSREKAELFVLSSEVTESSK